MSQPPVLPPNERRILRLDEVEAKSGFKRIAERLNHRT